MNPRVFFFDFSATCFICFHFIFVLNKKLRKRRLHFAIKIKAMKTLEDVYLSKKRVGETSLEERNKQLVRFAVEEVWNKGNYSVLDDIIAQDFIIRPTSPGKEVIGREGVIRYFSYLRAAFPDIRFTIQDQVAEGNKVATKWLTEGTHLGEFEGNPPTGKHFRITAIDIDYIVDGRFTECWTNIDELGLLQQLGVLTSQAHNEQDELRIAWDQIAEGYDKYVSDTEIWLANEALRLVGLRKGQTFLDVAAGAGGLSLPAARLGAKVLATDWSPEMIRRFEKRVREERLLDAQGKVMDGHQLELEDDQFDLTGSQFGVMLFPDQAKALREMVRVTKPGGKVFLIAYGAPEKIDFLNFFISALQTVSPEFPGLPNDPPPLEFQVADPTVLHQRLAEAGLKEVKVETLTERLRFTSDPELWNWLLYGNPIVGHILSMLALSNEQIEKVKEALDNKIKDLSTEKGYAILTNPINIGYGVK